MLLIKLACAFLFVLIGQIECAESEESKEDDSECVMFVQSIYMCKETSSKSEFKFDAKDSGRKDKIFDIDVELVDDINKTTSFEMLVYIWKDGAWNEFHRQSGPLCESQQQVISKASSKLRSSAKPVINDPCIIKAGHYTWKDMELSRDDVDMIQLEQADKFKVIYKLDNMMNKNVMCMESEIDVIC